MKFDSIRFSKMRNNTHFQFHGDNIAFIDEQTPQLLKIEVPYQKYKELYAKVDAALKNIVKSPLTKLIHEADKARDEIWEGLTETNKAALKHFDPQVRESARQVKIVIDTYGKSKLPRMSLIDQTSALTNVVQDLEDPYLQHVTKVGLLPWLVELKARNIAVLNLMRDRIDETSMKLNIVLKQARADVDDAFYEIISIINAHVVLEGSAVYEPYMRKLNANVSKYKILMAHAPKRGKRGNGEAGETTEDGSDEDA